MPIIVVEQPVNAPLERLQPKIQANNCPESVNRLLTDL